ncbi:MAG: hypothetical protein UR25_C0005G0023 [Candidatus Nomurabacteria bacterium GW2011_GWE1_32_28]|uniref:Uncharacterized protein n=1 Tax=Candidatus Nomurabacteria bacterium GW2011_GWF1_31_48 TaxID=1618767 RepID=A0A0G0ATP0_9BACT|nr:MAG: hypothetical protein UR10_C0003G0221 [Candidatus Nomurabacteria bacterium GW2011_GWF2_30_133]KKP28440.1 MAG: hypothetical protein UR18_C0004G0022 [Candidatus Nomurabacteria bacterium GW2011_GWE2_31_40]KKP30020.1 MAG: hypothetical protein UR19_C0005G0022 [Candidatus Nomurabacteria bacterium GW2011_GWF1_31_48]KKP34539.1 MAG: hypothetical protein UR25_C0005G0023 [Candidatus Nomurabacteria bacterium GW2011_GWE1_32_28]
MKKVFIIYGSDDQIVSSGKLREISKNLNCELVFVPGGKYLNGSSRFY